MKKSSALVQRQLWPEFSNQGAFNGVYYEVNGSQRSTAFKDQISFIQDPSFGHPDL